MINVAQRNEKLDTYLTHEVASQFTEQEKNYLDEYFSISELRSLAGQDVASIKRILGQYSTKENNRRLTHISPEEYEGLKSWYKERAEGDVEEIYCSKCGALLGIEFKDRELDANAAGQFRHHEGKFIVAIGDCLLAYRPRLDGVIGYQCGNTIESKEAKKAWDEYRKHVGEFPKLVANFDKEKQKYEKLKEEDRQGKPIPSMPGEPIPPAIPEFVICGNDTRYSTIEVENIPEENVATDITKDDIMRVAQAISKSGYEPDVKETKDGRKVETFQLKKLK